MFKFAHMADVHIGAHKDKRLIDLEKEQSNLFHNALPIYLINNDEPLWIDYQDTINVINEVIKNPLITKKTSTPKNPPEKN